MLKNGKAITEVFVKLNVFEETAVTFANASTAGKYTTLPKAKSAPRPPPAVTVTAALVSYETV